MKRRLLTFLRYNQLIMAARWTSGANRGIISGIKRHLSKIIITTDQYLCCSARSSPANISKALLPLLLPIMLTLNRLEAQVSCYKEKSQLIRTINRISTTQSKNNKYIRIRVIKRNGSLVLQVRICSMIRPTKCYPH